MSGNFDPNSRFSYSTPNRRQQFNHRQPLYLPPNSPFMSPRTNRTPSPRNRPSGGSPDFIPLGISSPVYRPRHNWNRSNFSNSSNCSAYSTSSTPPSFNSNHGYTPYKRHGSRNNSRGRSGHNHSGNSGYGSGSPPIHLYFDKEALEDPWAELADKVENKQKFVAKRDVKDCEKTVESSSSEISDDGES